MYKYNIYIGLFDKDTKQQELSNTEFLNQVRKVMRLKDIKNYTIIKAKGHYTSPNQVVCEPSLIVEIIEAENWTNYSYINDLKRMLCDTLNQESILITKQSIEVL